MSSIDKNAIKWRLILGKFATKSLKEFLPDLNEEADEKA